MAAQYSQYSHYNSLLYRLHSHWYLWTVSNYMLIISHRDVNHTDTGTFSTKHANIYENCWRRKKRNVFFFFSYCAKKIAKLRPYQMTGASQRVSCAVARERQNSNKQSSVYLWLFFFWMISFCLGHCLLQNRAVFFTTKMLFLSVICSITDTNNNSPSRDETKQRINDLNYNVVVSLD